MVIFRHLANGGGILKASSIDNTRARLRMCNALIFKPLPLLFAFLLFAPVLTSCTAEEIDPKPQTAVQDEGIPTINITDTLDAALQAESRGERELPPGYVRIGDLIFDTNWDGDTIIHF